VEKKNCKTNSNGQALTTTDAAVFSYAAGPDGMMRRSRYPVQAK